MKSENNFVGFIRYSGDTTINGFMDARKSAKALLGADEAIRFFLFKQSPSLNSDGFELPVLIKKGSWEIGVPEIIKVIGGIYGAAYVAKAGQKMAENDFEKVGLKDVLKKSLQAIQWTIRIGKHLGSVAITKFHNVHVKNDNELIGIRNSEGEILYVPKGILDLYVGIAPNILNKLSELVEDKRVLSIGVYDDNGEVEQETLTQKHKNIFLKCENKDIEIFPELEHGQNVSLDGEATRGNETANNMGFKYEGHILTCFPKTGSIVRFKPALFLKCRIHGTISRIDDKGYLALNKPRILIDEIEILEPENLDLF